MHVHARIEGLRVHARIPSLGCLCACLLVSRDERALHLFAFTEGPAFVGLHLVLSVRLHVG
jgi:hypothetical protein